MKSLDKSEQWFRSLFDDDSILICRNCQKRSTYTHPGAEQLLLDKPPTCKHFCNNCGSPMPWLDYRTYGLTVKELSNRFRHAWTKPVWDELTKSRTPLWSISRK